MRRLVLLILALATLLPSLAQAYDILVLQSRRDPAFEEVLRGFRSGSNASQRVIVMSDYAEVDVIRLVREDHPRLILAIGDAALTAARAVRQTPVVAVMALGIHNVMSSHPNITGIDMFVAPERYISIFRKMNTLRVGVIHNPAKSGWYLKKARLAAAEAGIELVVREVAEPRQTMEQLSRLRGNIDTLWMLPDSTAVTRETTEAYFHFGQRESIPVVSFAAGYLKLGAAIVLEIDRSALGLQAGAMTAAILEESNTGIIPLEHPSGTVVKKNPNVSKHLNLTSNNP